MRLMHWALIKGSKMGKKSKSGKTIRKVILVSSNSGKRGNSSKGGKSNKSRNRGQNCKGSKSSNTVRDVRVAI